MWRKTLSPVLAAFLVLIGTGCPMRSAIWVLPGSTNTHLEFGISDKRLGTRSIHWGVLSVWNCQTSSAERPHAFWTLSRIPEFENSEWPTRVTYGVVPLGFTSDREPETLGPGCYEAAIVGTGVVKFVIDTSGAIHELPSNQI